jgi:MFS family permease
MAGTTHLAEKPAALPPAPAPSAPPRSSAAHWIIVFHGISSFCYGMVFPYTGIFLSERPGVGTGGVAVYYAVSGAANLAVAVVLAIGLMRPPRVALGVTGNLLSVAGYLVLPAAGSLPVVGLAAVAGGAGQGCFLAAVIPIMSSLVSEADRRRMFARRYQVLNATLALGSLAAGVVTTALSRDAIPHLFLINAIGYLPIAATLLLTRKASAAAEQARAAEQPGDTAFPVALLLKASFAVALFQFGVYLFGYSQFEATAPLVAYKLMHTDLGWIPVLITVNVAVIVAAQHWVTRVLEPRSEVFGLRVAIGLWVAGYLLVGLMAFTPPATRLAGLLLYAALFGLGECAYSCSYHPWLISKVPDGELTRANALSNSMMGIGMFAGPSIGVGLVTTGSAALVWLSLSVLCAVVGLATVRRKSRARGRHRRA